VYLFFSSEIPLFHVLNARITFGNIFSLEQPVVGVTAIKDDAATACVVDESVFEPSSSYSVRGMYLKLSISHVICDAFAMSLIACLVPYLCVFRFYEFMKLIDIMSTKNYGLRLNCESVCVCNLIVDGIYARRRPPPRRRVYTRAERVSRRQSREFHFRSKYFNF